jgi:hypothetical protein
MDGFQKYWLGSLLRPKNTRGCGETSSHHVVIEVVIYYLELVRKIKSPDR